MPPKVKGKKSKGKKKEAKADDAEEPLSLEMQNLFLKRQIESLKHRLIMAANQASESEANAHQLRERLQVLHDDFVEERKSSFAVNADMTRQYKAMKLELMQTINALNDQVMAANDRYSQKEADMQAMEAKKDDVIALKNAEIAEWKQKVDEMALEFSQMLKQTLDKMSERIVISNDDWDGGGGAATTTGPHVEPGGVAPVLKRLEGFTLANLPTPPS